MAAQDARKLPRKGRKPKRDPRYVTTSISWLPEQLEEINRAAEALYLRNRSLLIAEAVEFFLAHLRKTRNDGKRFGAPEILLVGRRNRARLHR